MIPRMKEIFVNLAGGWIIDRTVSNKSRLQGHATFKAAQFNTLNYHEEGTLTLITGETFQSYQNYIFRFEDAGLAVLFTDGRLFHWLEPARKKRSAFVATGVHLCGDDYYKAFYEFPDGIIDHFTILWSVQGPRKNYTMKTHYRKESSS